MLKQLFYSGPSIGVLHEEYAKKGRIDEMAPITTAYEVRIETPVERVWELLSAPPDWETFAPDIHDVHLDSGVKADARFTWSNGKVRMESRFAVVDAAREITWTGAVYGVKAVHRHVLEPTGDGGATQLLCEESMAGPLPSLFFNNAKLQAGLKKWLGALKTAAEER